ncbi:cobalamin-5'-phosphate synthase [Devosia enhydra]|uniref:Adenosylcobinamide-GDP ribazoletransferase n=1 Tax=Devosia enhydra TaxID=665118 RepID=A0A1K2I243_9HYPH|nr:adenosylcobinamide-GDP ribazoletransferase [Devosia enhydra]SFZ85820.1 cobalamin-5'-phosphate synthase [Devosia enhydra]
MNDDVPTRGEPPRDDRTLGETALGLRDDVIMALRFFSRLPTGDSPHLPPDLNRIALGLPFASLLIGLVPALLLLMLALLGLPPLFAAGLAIGLHLLLSGAMSEDALADAADGLFGGMTVERRLEIMRDSRHGTFGVAALCLLLVLKLVALGTIASGNALESAALWLGAGVLARSIGLFLAHALPPLRRDGASASAGQPRRTPLLIGLIFALGIGFLLVGPALGLIPLIVSVVFAAGAVFAWGLACHRLVGGQTGDLVGAAQALAELAIFTAFLLFA